jgi:hypothetical protein
MLQINNGSVEVDASIMGTQQDGKKVKVPLNSSDKLYKEIRDLNFEVVVQVHSIDFNSCLFHMNELCGFTSKSNIYSARLCGSEIDQYPVCF